MDLPSGYVTNYSEKNEIEDLENTIKRQERNLIAMKKYVEDLSLQVADLRAIIHEMKNTNGKNRKSKVL